MFNLNRACFCLLKRLEQIFLEKFPIALDNLARLIKETSYEIDSSLKLPRFNPERPAVEELRGRAIQGLEQKGLWNQIYQARLEEELSVIHDMGFDDYSWLSGTSYVSVVLKDIIWGWDVDLQLEV